MLYMFEIVQSMMSSMYSVIYNLKIISTGNIGKSKVKVNTGILYTFNDSFRHNNNLSGDILCYYESMWYTSQQIYHFKNETSIRGRFNR